jgi:hypothetical protein
MKFLEGSDQCDSHYVNPVSAHTGTGGIQCPVVSVSSQIANVAMNMTVSSRL